MPLSNELEHDEKTDWLRGCGWPRWFACKPLHLIIATPRIPPSNNKGVHLGTWDCMEWVTCSASETKLRKLLEIVALMLDRCGKGSANAAGHVLLAAQLGLPFLRLSVRATLAGIYVS
jgi:hypothetical protein